LQDQIRAAIGKSKRVFTALEMNESLLAEVSEKAEAKMREAYKMPRKLDRHAVLGQIRDSVVKGIASDDASLRGPTAAALEALENHIVRDMILKGQQRIDGRSYADIRAISAEVGILPRAHGSGLFNRGETQALAALALGTSSDEQRLDYVAGEETRSFILHYNFPPYCVGEAKSLRSPGRRE